jgi:hypothetical protein
MRPASNTVVRRLVACALLAVLVGVASLIATSPFASAEPSTEERHRVAAEVAESFCRNVPAIPVPRTVDTNALCISVIVENIDPEGSNSGVQAACVAALPTGVKYLAKACADALDRLLDPARVIFLDRVVPAVQQLACVTSTPAAFDCLTQQVHVWLKQSIVALWSGLVIVLTADTEAIKIIAGWRHADTVSLYEDIGGLGALMLLGLMITSLIISILRFDFRHFGSTLLGVVMWGIFWASGVTIAVLLIKASDGASRWLAGSPDAGGQSDLDRAGAEFTSWVDYISGVAVAPGAVRPAYDPGSLTGLLICLLLVVAIVVTLVALLMRNIALLMLIVLLPLTLAGSAGPALTRSWLNAAIRMFVALLLAKPLIVIAVRLGAALVSVPREGEAQATFSDALLGVAVILLAGLLPGVIYRFSGGLMTTQAGAAPRAGNGLSEQSAHAATSSFDMARMMMEHNVPQPLSVASSGGAASSGTARLAGSSAGGLGAAAGPVGAVVTAAAVLGGATESGGRWMAGQAATAGGVLGDVEAPRVPAPPVPRVGRFGDPAEGQAGPSQDQGQTRATANEPQPIYVSVVQTPSTSQARAQLPGGTPPLVIPDQTEPEPQLPSSPAPPKALSPGKDEPR